MEALSGATADTMNMFSNLSTQASGIGTSLGSWFKKDGKAEGEEGQEGEAKPEGSEEKASPSAADATEKPAKESSGDKDEVASNHSG